MQNASPNQRLGGPFVHESTAGGELIKVVGEVDISNAQHLEDAIRTASQDSKPITVDLTECTYLDSCSVHILVQAKTTNGKSLKVIAPANSAAQRVFEILGLEEVLQVVPGARGQTDPQA